MKPEADTHLESLLVLCQDEIEVPSTVLRVINDAMHSASWKHAQTTGGSLTDVNALLAALKNLRAGVEKYQSALKDDLKAIAAYSDHIAKRLEIPDQPATGRRSETPEAISSGASAKGKRKAGLASQSASSATHSAASETAKQTLSRNQPHRKTRSSGTPTLVDLDTNISLIEEEIQSESTNSPLPTSPTNRATSPILLATEDTTTSALVQGDNASNNEDKDEKTSDVAPRGVYVAGYSLDDFQHLLTPSIDKLQAVLLHKSPASSKEFYNSYTSMTEDEKSNLKRKLGVTDFPEHEMSDILPSSLYPVDESMRQKPQTQTPFVAFQTFIEPFFKNLTETDLQWLDKHNENEMLSPFVIPPLGCKDGFTDEDIRHHTKRNSTPANSKAARNVSSSGSSCNNKWKVSCQTIGSADSLTDELLTTNQVSCGPLTERLLCSLIRVDSLSEFADGTNGSLSFPDYQTGAESVLSPKTEFSSIESNLHQELEDLGFFAKGEQIDWSVREDDEISASLKQNQTKLLDLITRNTVRKQKLKSAVKTWLAYQEFRAVLDELDKQIDQVCNRRMRIKNKRKKSASVQDPTTLQAELSKYTMADPAVRSLMEKRQKWIQTMGSLFKPQWSRYGWLPNQVKSIFENIDEDVKKYQLKALST